ncbi:MAG: PEP/pyruvate-binding domain-containing protein [Desulfobacterales bacterium]
MGYHSRISTGWKSLDGIIDGLRRGDNVVWQVDGIEDYQRLVTPFVNTALANNERVVYMRFARHGPLVKPGGRVAVYDLKTENGFETFSAEVHSILSSQGRDVCYVFDSLSDLQHVWATDLMIGDFFFITCPYLYELNTTAYFAILRRRHSFKAIARIREITQVLIDVYNYQTRVCIHPVKVQHRYSPTMFFPHVKEKGELVPVINSVEASRLFSHLSSRGPESARRRLDYWDRLFLQARQLLESGGRRQEKQDMVEQLSRLLLTRNRRVLSMIRSHLELEDLLEIKERLIGTGFIGGKSVGMLLARNILARGEPECWSELLEHHDSFYIGSDVFYSYIVQNGWWKLFMSHKTPEGYFEKAAELRERMLEGVFPEEITEQFQLMLEYFGQSPIIVRSSSLLEDAFGSAFAGKYESYFCVNQGSPEERYQNFEEAVRRIFASTMSEDALEYRRQRGLDRMDEQMALLVQRVSGSYHHSWFYPELAGVGLSRNPFVWKKGMDPEAGMIRLVFGLGTRAVNRVENDYPRIIALDDPLVRPLAGMNDIRRFSQHSADLLNLEKNRIETHPVNNVLERQPSERFEFLGATGGDAFRVVTFDPFLKDTAFVDLMGKMLACLEKAYKYPVDIEFTVNFSRSGDIQVNLLQCRPLQVIGEGKEVSVPYDLPPERTIVSVNGNFMGGSLYQPIEKIIFVDPRSYAELSRSDKYSVARLIGKLNRAAADRKNCPVLLMGPGRWGTHSPEMGVCVNFAEINHVAAMAEISYRDGSLIPDLSFGTHFFHDLIETGIFYLAVYPESRDVILNLDWIRSLPNRLEDYMPQDRGLAGTVKVADTGNPGLVLCSSTERQKAVCYLAEYDCRQQTGF